MKQNLGFGIGIARHRIKHGLSSMISFFIFLRFFEPPGVGEEVEALEGGEIAVVVVVVVAAVGTVGGGIEVVGEVIGEEVVIVHGGG